LQTKTERAENSSVQKAMNVLPTKSRHRYKGKQREHFVRFVCDMEKWLQNGGS